ncbi:uncharacterized protein LOC130667061 [Microplitis mediator]|uniref:uncharacterized protein LOC130667061 n=1 Tax=Microplitis mediator TaxID=375433 RepID=UPI00255537B6|nr:uncharacterized protein LOC130667061 [Microplitis mediator]
MLLFVIFKLFLIAQIQGKIEKNCLHVDDHCSNNDDCCSHKCLYSTESSNSICVSEVETSDDLPLALPMVSHNLCFLNRRKCSTDRDCYCSQKCFFIKGISDGFCSTVILNSPNGQITRVKKYSSTTVLSVEKPKTCASLGSICSENTDCCSDKCGRATGKYYHACVSNTNDSFDKKISELPPIITDPAICIMSGHYCVADDDCCTKICANSKINFHYHYCQFAYRPQ